MITYDVPKPKISEAEEVMPVDYAPCIYLPVNKEIIEALKVGEQVRVELVGEVKSLDSSESASNADRYDIRIEVSQVKIDEENEYSKLAKEDEEDD